MFVTVVRTYAEQERVPARLQELHELLCVLSDTADRLGRASDATELAALAAFVDGVLVGRRTASFAGGSGGGDR